MFRRLASALIPNWTLERILAMRLLRGRKGAYVTLISVISMCGLALGVASLIVILAVTTGFEQAFRDKLLGVYPHLVIIGKGGEVRDWRQVLQRLEGAPGLSEAAPATYDEMMASYRSNRSGAIVKGIDFSYPGNQDMLRGFLADGDVQVLDPALVAASSSPPGSYDLEPLPGGMVALFVLDGAPSAVGIPIYLEDPLAIVIVNATDSELTGQVPGILQSVALRLPAHAVSQPIAASPSGLSFTLGGEAFSLDETAAGMAFVVYKRNDRLVGAGCLIPGPASATDPAKVCLINNTDGPLLVNSGELSRTLDPGTLDRLDSTDTLLPGVLLGDELARRIEAEVGDEVRLISPLSTLSGLSQNGPKGRTIADTFRVIGTLHLGFYEYDSKLAIVGFDAARRFLHQGDTARWIEVRVQDLFQSSTARIDVGRRLRQFSLLDLQDNLPGIKRKFVRSARIQYPNPVGIQVLENVRQVLNEVRFSDVDGSFGMGVKDEHRIITWEEMNEPLFTSMKRQKIVLSLFFLIVIMVAAFNVVSSQIMVVREKSAEISMLKAMGAERGQIHRAFLWQGLVVGGVGVGIGAALAAAAGLFLKYIGFPLDPQVYFVSQLPVSLVWTDFAWAMGLALLLVYVSISLAARRASRLSPVEGLRNLE